MRELLQQLRDSLEDALDSKIHTPERIAAAVELLAAAPTVNLNSRTLKFPRMSESEVRDALPVVIRQREEAFLRIAALEKELAAAQKDAERYRWLRAQDYVVASKHPAELLVFGTAGVLDAAIDTAMKGSSNAE